MQSVIALTCLDTSSKSYTFQKILMLYVKSCHCWVPDKIKNLSIDIGIPVRYDLDQLLSSHICCLLLVNDICSRKRFLSCPKCSWLTIVYVDTTHFQLFVECTTRISIIIDTSAITFICRWPLDVLVP